MIHSLFDNDLYKFTMQQAVCQLYPHAEAEYQFISRDNVVFPSGFARRLQSRIRKMQNLIAVEDELDYVEQSCPFLSPVYLEYLRHYRYNVERKAFTIHVAQDPEGHLELSFLGPWHYTILWEVPLMALISRLYYQMTDVMDPEKRADNIEHNREVTRRLMPAPFADFGTRRRYSYNNHINVIRDILSTTHNSLIGTSNVHMAYKFGLRPIGTMAHEWIMFHGAVSGYQRANYDALEAWARVYRGSLGIALTDTYTTDMFLSTFDAYHAKLFDGVRHDSGDPFRFARKVINHYRKLGIDPGTKTIVFSDSLNPEVVDQIRQYCYNTIKCSFGIGTYLTNNVGVKPLNMVIKVNRVRLNTDSPWVPTVKLSDVETKHTGDPDELDLCYRTVKKRTEK